MDLEVAQVSGSYKTTISFIKIKMSGDLPPRTYMYEFCKETGYITSAAQSELK